MYTNIVIDYRQFTYERNCSSDSDGSACTEQHGSAGTAHTVGIRVIVTFCREICASREASELEPHVT